MLLGGFFFFWFLFVFAMVLVPLAFTVYALIDVGRTPEEMFGPPWDNGKSAWTLGLAVAFVVPAGVIVGPIMWWTQGRSALKRGQRVPRPFWSPGPRPPAPPGYGPPPVGPPPQA